MNLRARPIIIWDAPREISCARCNARSASVCSAVETTELARLADIAQDLDLPAGKMLVEEGEPARDFFTVTAGTIKLFKLLADGRQQVTGFAGPGYFLGLAASSTYAFSAEAIEASRVCRFARSKFLKLMEEMPQLEHRLFETACSELAAAQERMLLLGRRTTRERLANFLLTRLAETASCAHVDRIHLPMHRADIADYLGLRMETVSRAFSRFRAEKLIALPRPDVVVILDAARLAEAASDGGGGDL